MGYPCQFWETGQRVANISSWRGKNSQKLTTFSNSGLTQLEKYTPPDRPSPMKSATFCCTWIFFYETSRLRLSQNKRCTSYLLNYAKVTGFAGMKGRFQRTFNPPPSWEFLVVWTDPYNIEAVRFWWRSTSTKCTFLHVKFEGGSSASVLRKRASSLQKNGVQNRRVFKSSIFCKKKKCLLYQKMVWLQHCS